MAAVIQEEGSAEPRGDSQGEDGHVQKETDCSDSVTSPGTPGVTRNWKRPGGFSSRPCQLLASGLLASRTVKECVSVVSRHLL